MSVHFRRPLGLALICGALVLSACGSSGGSDGASGPTTTVAGTGTTASIPTAKDDTLAAMVPEKLAKAGKVVVATDAPYVPNEFFADDNKTLQGMDIDLGKAIGQVLGVEVTFVDADFDGIIPGLGSRYDLGMSSFTDNKEREAKVDMVTYLTAGESFMAKAGTNADVKTIDDVCGKTVGIEKGTVEVKDAAAQSDVCTKAGKEKIDVQTYPDQAGANLALNSGRVDLVFADSPVNAYAASQSGGKFVIVGEDFGEAPYGIAVPKGADYKGFADAVLGAVKKLAAEGTYKQILDKWGLGDAAITDFKINGADS